MNQEKIKNYNQKILAIVGTLAILLVAVLLFWASSEFIHDAFRSHSDEQPELISNEKAQENFEKNVRTHQVSFEDFWLADTLNNIYVIPVTQSALKLEEYTSKSDRINSGGGEVLHLMDSYESYSGFAYDQHSFNNALIYDSRDNSIKKLFDFRLGINQIKIEKINGLTYLMLVATNKDTHKDGVLNSLDSKSLYIYSIDKKILNEVKSENNDFIEFRIIASKNQLVIKYGLDKNNDGTFSWDEPVVMKVYSIQENRLSDLIPSGMVEELQNTLDGKNELPSPKK